MANYIKYLIILLVVLLLILGIYLGWHFLASDSSNDKGSGSKKGAKNE